jgi:hypothetical protein
MKKTILALLAVMALAGCKTTGKEPLPEVGEAEAVQIPDLPTTFREKAERLPDINDATLGGIHRDGVNTDVTYNDLAIRYNALVDAWVCVREAVNSRSTDNINKCFSEGSKK